MIKKTRTLLLSFLLITISFITLTGCDQTASSKEKDATDKIIRIGYQKFGTLNILKAEGTLEKVLEPKGFKVEWTEFPGGPQLLEALNVGSLDLGHTGEAPPIFAQAAGAPIVYFANEPINPKGEAILVPKDSPIQSVKDLKGKKIALNKGSNVHYLLVRALEEYGIQYEEIEPVFLAPADARAAFEQGSVDAWVIWDPFFAEAEAKTGARIIVDGTGLVQNREFFLASRSFAKKHSELLDIVYKEIEKAERKTMENKTETAAFLSPQLGIEAETLEKVLERRTFGIEKITKETIENQQKIADKFYELQLIPKKINTTDALLKADS